LSELLEAVLDLLMDTLSSEELEVVTLSKLLEAVLDLLMDTLSAIQISFIMVDRARRGPEAAQTALCDIATRKIHYREIKRESPGWQAPRAIAARG